MDTLTLNSILPIIPINHHSLTIPISGMAEELHGAEPVSDAGEAMKRHGEGVLSEEETSHKVSAIGDSGASSWWRRSC